MATGGFKVLWVSTSGLLLLSLASAGNAQLANIDKLGEQCAKQLNSLKPKMVAVADLSASQEDIPGQGDYLSEFLNHSIEHYAKKLMVRGHWEFDSDLRRDGVLPGSFVSAEAVSGMHAKIPEDILVIGTISRDAQAYAVSVSAVRVSNGQTLFSRSATFARTEFMDSWTEPFPPKWDSPIFKAGVSGIGTPKCIHCPDPRYSV